MRDTLLSLSGSLKGTVTFKPFSNYPPVIRDLSILVDKSVKQRDIEKVIVSSDNDGLLKNVFLYDIYSLENTQEKKSYTYTLTFRADDRTLTNQEVNKLQEKIVQNLNKKLGAELRK